MIMGLPDGTTPEPRGIVTHDQYVEAVTTWHRLRNLKQPYGSHPKYPGADFCAYLGTDPDKTFSWVKYPDKQVYVPAHCVNRILLLNGPYAETVFKAYCAQRGLGVLTGPDSAVV